MSFTCAHSGHWHERMVVTFSCVHMSLTDAKHRYVLVTLTCALHVIHIRTLWALTWTHAGYILMLASMSFTCAWKQELAGDIDVQIYVIHMRIQWALTWANAGHILMLVNKSFTRAERKYLLVTLTCWHMHVSHAHTLGIDMSTRWLQSHACNHVIHMRMSKGTCWGTLTCAHAFHSCAHARHWTDDLEQRLFHA